MKNLMKLSLILVLSVSVFSCSDGEDGAIGPEGPVGAQGDPGTQGDSGTQGDPGNPGTANVIFSDWIPNNFVTGGGLLQKVFTLANEQQITDLGINLEDSSVVLVYGKANILLVAGVEVFPLPYVNRATDERYTYTINDGTIRAVGFAVSMANNDFDRFDEYRYVIIPGGVALPPTTFALKSTEDYTKMSYKEIATLFNIPD